jgi:hypothetical protein
MCPLPAPILFNNYTAPSHPLSHQLEDGPRNLAKVQGDVVKRRVVGASRYQQERSRAPILFITLLTLPIAVPLPIFAGLLTAATCCSCEGSLLVVTATGQAALSIRGVPGVTACVKRVSEGCE